MPTKRRHVKVLHVWVVLIAAFHCQQIAGQGSKRNLQQQGQQKQSAERQRKAVDIVKYLNVTQDPCSDFYTYACGNWLKYQDVRGARGGDIVSETGQLESKVNRQVQLILSSPTTQRDVFAKPIKDFYRSCTQAPAPSPAQKQFINKFVSLNGGLPDLRGSGWQPNYNWIVVIGNLKRKYNLNILISLSRQNLRGNTVFLDEPQKTILPAQYCGAFATQQIEERDQAIQTEIKNNLKSWFDYSENDAYRVAGDIMSFEYQLCSNMRKDQMVDVLSQEDDQQQNPMNSRWQENKLHGVRRNMNNSPQQLRVLEQTYRLQFKQFVDMAIGVPLTNEVVLRSEDYFAFLATISNKGLQPSFANYIMYRALSEMTFPYNLRDADSRAAFCVQKVMQFFPEVVGSLFSNANNDRQTDRQNIKREDIRQIFADIKIAFKTYLDTNMKWMHQTTKRMIQNKVSQLEIKEPEYLDNAPIQGLPRLDANQNYWQAQEAVMIYTANRTLYKSSSQRSNMVEAFGTTVASSPTENQLQIGSALLQLPFYSQNYPKSLKYSGLGVVLAREMVKKYDQQGWQDNPLGGGNVNRDPLVMAGFNQNRECFRSQVSNYFFNSPELYRNGTQLRDFMADSLAVDIAFLAYLNWLDKEPEGPDLYMETFSDADFTNTQLFFLNFAQSRCAAKYRDPVSPDFFPLDRHTIERLNINGVLGNGQEFGRDFNCVAGTEMNLGDKCLYDSKNEIKLM